MKGFTLVEVLGVIIVIGILALITYPIINNTIKENKESLYNTQLEKIKDAALGWSYTNVNMLPIDEGGTITITLLELKKAGLVELDIRNPKTGELLPNDMIITITYKNNNYEINVDGESGSDITNDFNENAPILVLNGNYIEYVEINDAYQDKGALAYDKNGNSVLVDVIYQLNGKEVGSIDTSQFNTYTAIYSATSNGYTSKIARTIVIRDTTPPNLIVPTKTELTAVQLETFDLLEGVTVSDNSLENINIETRGFDRLPTDKIVEYKACDSNNNCTTKRRIIEIIYVPSFATDSWETIRDNVKNGKAEEYYKVGDTKEINVEGYGNLTVRIANMTTPSECLQEDFSQTACGFVVEFVNVLEERQFNGTSTNDYGWSESVLQKYLNNEFYNKLPQDLRNVIINTKTVSGSGSAYTSNYIGSYKIYLFSYHEIFEEFIEYDSSYDYTRQLDFYKLSNSSPIKSIYYANNNYSWWLRSAAKFDSSSFLYVTYDGGINSLYANESTGVSPSFRIG